MAESTHVKYRFKSLILWSGLKFQSSLRIENCGRMSNDSDFLIKPWICQIQFHRSGNKAKKLDEWGVETGKQENDIENAWRQMKEMRMLEDKWKRWECLKINERDKNAWRKMKEMRMLEDKWKRWECLKTNERDENVSFREREECTRKRKMKRRKHDIQLFSY